MIYTEELLDIQSSYPLETLYSPDNPCNPEKLLFFDIETTGLSAKTASVYLIGCLSFSEGRWKLIQWMAERFLEEQQVVEAFFHYCRNFDALIHFNGDTFDIPFLRKCAENYSMEHPFDRMESIDLLKRIRPLKGRLSLRDLKLKTIEKFLGIDREDLYTGGELIAVYHAYTKNGDSELLKLLLLHNAEDIQNMPALLSVLHYGNWGDMNFAIQEAHCDGTALQLRARCDRHFPVSVQFETCGAEISVSGDLIQICVPVMQGELFYFYPDYKNYFYLPAEGYAVHKKIAQFVDKEHRVKATPATAFSRFYGIAVPLGVQKKRASILETEAGDFHILRETYESKEAYTPFAQEEVFLRWYLSYLLTN